MACGTGLIRTRFAPSPTGHLHLGHAFAALTARDLADPGGFLLRIEDIDTARCKPDFEAALFEDLHWLGLEWPEPVMRQSDRLPLYNDALAKLAVLGVLYPCSCRRGDIAASLAAPQEGDLRYGPDGMIYPGTCRHRDMADAGPGDALRLDAGRAFDLLSQDLRFTESGLRQGDHHVGRDQFIADIGDVVVARRDIGTSYHLAVVLDDAAQNITMVTRGEDLAASTWIHVLLQNLLGLPTPIYHHHVLIRDQAGKRLAKRDDARAIRHYRAEGLSRRDVLQLLSESGDISSIS